MSKIVFVYAVDGGLFNSLTNFAHKILSPKTYACTLCSLTYGAMAPKEQWAQFIVQLGRPTEFLHRDEFVARYSNVKAPLPAAFLQKGDELKILVSAQEIATCATLDNLISLLAEKVGRLDTE